jgi:DNA-binding NtrC family response regulator
VSEREDSVLLVSHEPSETAPLRSFLAARGFGVHVTTALGAVQSLAYRSYGLVITEIGVPGLDGVALTRRALQLDHETHVLLIAHRGVTDELVDALRVGATDYISRPIVPRELDRKIRRYRDDGAFSRAGELIAESQAMKNVVSRAAHACAVALPVFLEGELGTGRQTIARAIHRFGESRSEPFLVINLKSTPAHLMATEIFGTRQLPEDDGGHFGILGAAGGGGVLLENVDAMSSAVQLKLIGALDTGMIHSLGPSLDALRIAIPRLRERPEDIPALALRFLRTLSDESDKTTLGIAPEALAALAHYRWPANIRELANVMERAFVLADDVVQLRHLPPQVSSVTVRAQPKRPSHGPEA